MIELIIENEPNTLEAPNSKYVKLHANQFCSRLGISTFNSTLLYRVINNRLACDGASPINSDGPWIAGGAVRRTVTGEKMDTDYDFFFKSPEQADAFEDALVNLGANLTSRNDKNSTYILPSMTLSETYEDGQPIFLPEIKIQVIRFRYYNSPTEVIGSFDFTLCQFAYDGEYIYMNPFSLYDVARKRLVPNVITYGVSSLRRMMKYAKQGFTVCSGALANVLNQVVDNPNVINAETEYID